MSPDELDRLNIVGIGGGLFDVQNPDKPICIVAPGAVNPDYFDVLRGVSLAHVAIKTQLDTLEALISAAEQFGFEEFVSAIMATGTACTLARRIACQGIETVQQQRNAANGEQP